MDTNVKAAAKAVWWLVLMRGIFGVIFGVTRWCHRASPC